MLLIDVQYADKIIKIELIRNNKNNIVDKNKTYILVISFILKLLKFRKILDKCVSLFYINYTLILFNSVSNMCV